MFNHSNNFKMFNLKQKLLKFQQKKKKSFELNQIVKLLKCLSGNVNFKRVYLLNKYNK